MKELLHKALQNNNHNLSPATEEKLITYLELLQQWNKVYNLTAIRDPKDMVVLHLMDSLAILPFLHGNKIIDIGSGAGLPGIPLALTNPDKQFVLLDSNSKKTRFLNQVVYELGIANISVEHARCENFHPDAGFDSIITRAFATLKDMIVGTQHLLDVNGQFLAMKGIYPQDEINDIPAPFKLIAVHPLLIKGLDAERHLVCVGK